GSAGVGRGGAEAGRAVAVPAVVVAGLGRLGGRRAVEARDGLRRRQLVVAGDREGAAEAGHAAGAVDLAQDAVGAGRRAPAVGGAAARPAEQLLDVGQDVLGLAPADRDQRLDELLGVGARHAPAADG